MCEEYTYIGYGVEQRHVTDLVGGGGCTRSGSLKLSHQSQDRRSHCRGRVGGDALAGQCITTLSHKHIPVQIKATGGRRHVIYLNSPALCCLQSHVPAMLGVEAGQEQIGLGQGRGGG